MNAIVCNTLTGAVSEYTHHAFQSISPRYGGSASGLYRLYGETDAGLPIVSTIKMPPTLRDNTLKTHLDMVYLSMRGAGCARFSVFGRPERWDYSFPLRTDGVSRCQPGKGIRENYVGFGLSIPAGQQFTLDRIEVLTVKSKTRRV